MDQIINSRLIFTIIIPLLGSIPLLGNSVVEIQERSDTAAILIPEFVITAQRDRTNNIDRPEAISKLTRPDPHLVTATSTPDALSAMPGVWMQKTNLGGGSPFLRGLTGYHTLILIDGIRLNNSTFRSGPNQYLNTVDPLTIENMEVMRGQGGVPYGSDALGGVIQLFTQSPVFSDSGKEVKASIYGKYMSKGMEKTSRATFEAGSRKTAFKAGASFRKLGDIVPGRGLSTLSPTGYSEKSADLKIKHKLKSNQLFTGSIQFHRQKDVPLYHKLTSGDYSKYHFDPQQRLLSYIRLESYDESLLFSKITYTVSFQNSLERRIKQKIATPVTHTEEDRVSTINGTVELLSRPNSYWTISSGVELYEDLIRSRTTSTYDSTDQSTGSRGLYPDKSRSDNLALYSLHSIDLNRISLVFGGRYNYVRLSVTDELLGETKITPSALIGNVGLNYKLSQQIRLVTSVSSGFRAPNINDVSSLGIADFRYEIPNYELKPEKNLNMDLGVKIATPRFSGNLFLFRNKLDNLITNVKTSYNGNDSIDGFQVYQRVNLNEALIKGFEADGTVSLTTSLRILGNISYTHGKDLLTGAPLRRIPPLNSRVGIRHFIKNFSTTIEWAYAGEQSRLSQGDIDDNRIREGGTPSWNTIDCSLGYSGSFFQLNAGILNIFNEAYRVHGSGIDGRGRSIWISLKLFSAWK
ncbi:MAG: TonB-dependent receptor [Bacteroidota bacterium]